MNKEEWKELEDSVDMDKIWAEIDKDREEKIGEPRLPGDIDTTQYARRYKVTPEHARKLFLGWSTKGHDRWNVVWVWDEDQSRSRWVIRLKDIP